MLFIFSGFYHSIGRLLLKNGVVANFMFDQLEAKWALRRCGFRNAHESVGPTIVGRIMRSFCDLKFGPELCRRNNDLQTRGERLNPSKS
jgi:hypothetical protein